MRYLKTIFLITLMTFYSCNQLSQQEKDCEIYEKSLLYIEEFNLHEEGKVFMNVDIEKNIDILETTSGIESEVGLELLGRTRITDKDLTNWRNWFQENCNKNNTN